MLWFSSIGVFLLAFAEFGFAILLPMVGSILATIAALFAGLN
jgi:hypothetical protein